MAEQDQSRPEDASPYKLEQARKKGSVARGQDLPVFMVILALAVWLWVAGPQLASRLARLMQHGLAHAGRGGAQGVDLRQWALGLVSQGLEAAAPLFVTLLLAALLAVLLQVGFLFAPDALKPDFERLHPKRVLERLFSMQSVVELLRSVLKLAASTAVAALLVAQMLHWPQGGAESGLLWATAMHSEGLRTLFWLAAVLGFFALLDLLFVRWQFARQMRMSHRELREETRHREGDPQIRQMRRRMQAELLKKTRSMQAMRGADVLVTNPTHYAVALKYDAVTMLAPCAVAKGAGSFALRLKRLALVYGVPVVEHKALARKLYFKVALNDTLPAAVYEPVAQIYLKLRAGQAVQPQQQGA